MSLGADVYMLRLQGAGFTFFCTGRIESTILVIQRFISGAKEPEDDGPS
jgi:hypothetical protein